MPASFPTSVKTFPTRNTGDVITDVFFNDPNAEITAIETGYLQGTAPLNSSNSTVANLSVSGNCTVVGNLTVNGTFTPGGSQNFSSIVTANAQPQAVVYRNSTQSLSSNTNTALSFDSQDFNIGSLHSTATQPTRMTVQSTGLYHAVATVVFSTTATNNQEYLWFRKNGTTQVGSRTGVTQLAGNGFAFSITGQTYWRATSTGDYLEVMVFQNSGSAQESGNASSRVDQNQFQMVKVW